jgi:Tfp pilus assembly protein PilF
MECRDNNLTPDQVDERIDKYLAGEMADDERAVFEDHIFECEKCYTETLNDARVNIILKRQGTFEKLDEAFKAKDWVKVLEYVFELEVSGYTESVHPILTRKGFALRELGKIDAAFKIYEQAVKVHPEDADVISSYGWFFLNRRDWSGATDIFNKAVKVDSNHGVSWKFLGTALAMQSKFNEAKSALLKAKDLRHTDLEINIYLANTAVLSGDIDDASHWVDDVYSKIPQGPYTPPFLNVAGLVEVYKGNLETAIKTFSDLVASDLSNPHYVANLGLSYWRTGEPDKMKKALEFYERAISIQPDNKVAVKNLAEMKSALETGKHFEPVPLVAMG